MKKIKIIAWLLFLLVDFSYGQDNTTLGIRFSGVVMDEQEMRPLANVNCRDKNGIVRSDNIGRFLFNTMPGDTVYFSYVGYKTFGVIVPDTLIRHEYTLGVFLLRDTVKLGEVLILPRFSNRKQNEINARNNMRNITYEALAGRRDMDAEMNQRMQIDQYARDVEYKGPVYVGFSVGTPSYYSYEKLKQAQQLRDRGPLLDQEEIDLLKMVYDSEKREKQNN